MTESDDTATDTDDNDLGGVLGEVGLEYDDEEPDHADDVPMNNDAADTAETSASESESSEDPARDTSGHSNDPDETGATTDTNTTVSGMDNGPFAPEPGMQLTKSLGTKLTPPEKEFIELYVEFSDEYEHPGEFLREFVDQLRQEYGEEVMRRKQALEELKGGL